MTGQEDSGRAVLAGDLSFWKRWGVNIYKMGPGKPVTRWWFIFFIFTPIPGEMIQFDEHIFQMGWNHQLGYK